MTQEKDAEIQSKSAELQEKMEEMQLKPSEIQKLTPKQHGKNCIALGVACGEFELECHFGSRFWVCAVIVLYSSMYTYRACEITVLVH